MQLHSQESLPSLKHPWRKGVALGRAYELLRADTQQHLAFVVKELGFEYCRFHGLFHDDMAVAVRQEDGSLAFQWSHIDKIFDFMLSIGVRPFAELGPMPKALASGPTTFFHWSMNVTPPADFAEWGLLVEKFARHCIDRYGIDEVRQWRFEVWNEPNLDAFWTGTMEQYWRLYETAARALKAVDSELKVGGPASAEAGWIPEFLEFTEKNSVPVDFVSTHAYPQNEFAPYETRAESPHAPGMYFVDIVKEKSALAKARGLEVHWTEWSALDASNKADVDWYANETIDTLSGAALVCHVCSHLDDTADSLFWWVATDIFEEMGMPQSPFANSFGMVSIDCIPKGSFHAFKYLNRMQGRRLPLSLDAPHAGCGALAVQNGSLTKLLLWNHVAPGEPQVTWSDEISVDAKGLATLAQVKAGAGSAYEGWVEMGRPQNPTPFQQECLRALSQPEHSFIKTPDQISFSLAPGEILFIELAGEPDPYVLKGTDASATSAWNQSLSDIPTQ